MSVSLPSSKYVQEVADTRLSNTLSPAHINASDFRKLKGSTFQGEHIHNNTFDRGEFTGGWDHTQTLNRKAALDATKKLDQAAATARSRWNQKIEGKYKPLEKQYEEQLQTIRNMKLSNSWDPKVGLSKQPEGEQPVKRRHRPGRATKDDVAAVSELDGFEQMLSTLELQKQSQSEQQDEQ